MSMKTKYEIVIDAIAYALEDHSYNTQWYSDFDEQDTVPLIEETDCYPEEGHRLLRIEPMESWESFGMMEDFVETVADEAVQNKLWSALRQRHPFSAFKRMLDYVDLRESWFAFKDERMQRMVERWMRDEGVVYKDGTFTCDNALVFEKDDDWEDELPFGS